MQQLMARWMHAGEEEAEAEDGAAPVLPQVEAVLPLTARLVLGVLVLVQGKGGQRRR